MVVDSSKAASSPEEEFAPYQGPAQPSWAEHGAVACALVFGLVESVALVAHVGHVEYVHAVDAVDVEELHEVVVQESPEE